MHTAPIAQLAEALRAGRLSSVELTRALLDRIDAHAAPLNAFLSVDREGALARASAADASRASGRAGPLTGIPVAHKDMLMTAGLKTTCGSRMLEHFVAPYDAFVVEQLAEAGMVLIGKTNMDEFAMGSSNETSYFGPVQNPWDPTRVPGGSSGGSAAAVAARLVPAATGTDTGGSIRQPAALSGICGLKPTYGVVLALRPDRLRVEPGSGRACSRRPRRIARLLLNAMAGYDARDSTSLDRPAEDYTRDLARPLQGLRIGLPKEYFADGTEPGVDRRRRGGARRIAQAGRDDGRGAACPTSSCRCRCTT